MHLFLETTPKNPPICYREMCLVFWPQNYNFYPKSHICKRFPFINKLVKKTQSPLRRFYSIGASEATNETAVPEGRQANGMSVFA